MSNISLSPSGPPEFVLPKEAEELYAAVGSGEELAEADRREYYASVVADFPESSLAWSRLGDCGRDVIESYAAYRVGYHRGLDQLRKNGWRGSGYVRCSEGPNEGFWACLAGLAAAARTIGETGEAQRCELFMKQLDPDCSHLTKQSDLDSSR